MNAFSAASVAGATAAAAFAGVVAVALLSHSPARPAASAPHFAPSAPSTGALVPAAPMLQDCAPFAPAGPDGGSGHNPVLLAGNDATPPPNNAAPNDAAPNELNDGSDRHDGGCDPDGEPGAGSGPEVGGLGSGWIISADGVMRMNPYSLSDTHSITVRPAEPLREFKGRVIGLGRGGAMPQGAQSSPEGKERRPLLVVRARVVRPAGQGANSAPGAKGTGGQRTGPTAFAFAAPLSDPSPLRRDRV